MEFLEKITPREYRKRISALRNHIVLLEQYMSAKVWDMVDYSKLPAQAHKKHTKAFGRNDYARYTAYLQSVEKGEAKINSGTLFTYEIYEKLDGSFGMAFVYNNEWIFTSRGSFHSDQAIKGKELFRFRCS